jgi:RNA polymerase sigma factor for flagellar operon FliA
MRKQTSNISESEHHRLIRKQTPLVEKIARHMARKLPASVDCDDLVQDGLLGLIDAILRGTKEMTDVRFESYVAQRAQGAMIDGLRANDPGTRQIRKDMRRVELAIQRLGHQYGRAPQEGEVAADLGLPIAEYQRILQDAHGYLLISLEDLGGDGEDAPAYLRQCAQRNVDPFVVLERAALRNALAGAISAMPEQRKTLLRLYYEEDMKMHQIGSVLQLSESRVSQLHTLTIAQLRAAIFPATENTSLLKLRKKVR